jgi:S-DNA-T family DNA segregation ATPase FtsK/SpoIIIE
MPQPPNLDGFTHWLIIAGWSAFGLLVLVTLNRYGIGYSWLKSLIRKNPELRASVWQAARIRRHWPKLARHLGLVLLDKTVTDHPSVGLDGKARTTKPRVVIPRMRVVPDDYGVIAKVKTVPGVGLEEVQKAGRHLADDWRAVRVAVTQPKPGWITIRAVRRDPLATKIVFDPQPGTLPIPTTLREIEIGVDEYAEPVSLRLSGLAGILICGLPGAGKTSFINNFVIRLSPHPAVQFAALDGKVDDPMTGDYADVADRFAVLLGDDLGAANVFLRDLVQLRRQRAANIRAVLGRKNVWDGDGPSIVWPLLMVIIDEAQTYFRQVKDGGNREIKERNALAAQNVEFVEDLIKKGRSVGIIIVLATQKGTGDAIPTQIRDVCGVSLAFACRTIEAAVAALGDDIRLYPECNPVALQDPSMIGVCVMAVQGRIGFTRVRTPLVPDHTAAAVAQQHRELVPARGKLPIAPTVPAAITAGEKNNDEDDD